MNAALAAAEYAQVAALESNLAAEEAAAERFENALTTLRAIPGFVSEALGEDAGVGDLWADRVAQAYINGSALGMYEAVQAATRAKLNADMAYQLRYRVATEDAAYRAVLRTWGAA